MKAINLKESITLQNISGEAFVLRSDGTLAPLHAGMDINTGTIIVLTDNGTISAIDKTGAPAELSYELIQNIQLPTSYEHIFSVTDENAIDNESIHIAEQTTAAFDELQKIHDAILDGIDPTKVQQATAAGNENSSNWGVVTIDYDNDKMLAEAGFDTAYQPGAVEYPEDYSGLNDHLSIEASITIDSISQDDVVTAAESNAMQTITGTVGGDVKAGDIVTVTLDGKEIGKATVVNNNGKLEWSLDVDGKTLLQAGIETVSATVTTNDDVGNSATATTTHDYTIDIQASITIDPITGDNVITQQEGHEPTLPITGSVGKDVLPGDTVTVTINGNEYTTTVQPDMSWTVNVTGDDILHADKATASVTTSYGSGHEATATDTESYEVTIEAKVTIETIAGDGVVNQEESEGKVPVTGTVGGDVKEGDTVTITVNGKDYTTTVGKDGSWTVDVDGSDLVENGDNPIHATVTTCDGAGHCATADNDKGYDIDTDINAQITIDSISQDDVVTAAESHSPQTITGTVGGDVKAGDIVTVILDGKEIGKVTVVNNNGKLEWSLDVDGKTLLQAGVDTVSATVTATDDAGNSATANTTHDYTIDIQASITIDPITGDNVITQQEGHEPTLPITGTVGKDVLPGDTVTVTINGNEYTTTVQPDMSWTVNVTGDDILHADKATASVTTNYGTNHEATATDTESYEVTIEAKVTIETIAGDGVVNQEESEGKVPVTGTVGGDVKEGDTVTITVNGKDYTTTVGKDGSWTVDVDGSDLVENGDNPIHATVTTCDGAGHCATADNDKGYDIDTDINAQITIDSISQDDVVTAAESHSPQTITGTVGGDVKAGDIVTVILDGKEIGKATVVNNNGKLEWSLDVDGKTLLQAGVDTVSATVTATDDAGNSATANTTHDYTIDIQASITIDPITGDNVITQQEGHEPTLPITGTVGKDVLPGDTVTVTINGNEYTTTVQPDMSWTVNVTGDDILHADKATASVTTNYGTNHEATATDTESYEVTIEAKVTIETIAGDGVVNQEESEGKVPVTGTVGGDVKEGDTVTITVNGKDYTTTVGKGGSWTVDVDGSDLVENGDNPIHATVTTCDGAGHCATANNDKGYDIDTDINADITITVIAEDDVINEAEAEGKVSISGTVGGDVKEGDTVTLTLDGKEIGTATVEKDANGKLVWTATDIDGKTLADADLNQVTASVTATDDAGNSKTATTTHDYKEAVLDVTVDITSVAEDNVLNADESTSTVAIKGTVGGDAKAGDMVTVTLDGKELGTAEVVVGANGKLEWTLEVEGSTLAGATVNEVEATITISDDYGNTATAEDKQDYLEKDLTVSVDITSVAEDNVLNADESTSTVAIKGTVGGDAKAGDIVTVTLDGKELGTAEVVVGANGKLEWTLEVEGSTLAGATVNEVEATITISDDYGNTASDEDKQDYLEKDLTVSVDITSVAEDNVLNADESTSTVAIKGTVGGDAKAGDMVTVTLDGKELGTAKVVVGENGKLEWTLEVEVQPLREQQSMKLKQLLLSLMSLVTPRQMKISKII
ncbi:retention module-containing protein [Photobacterium leiognathi]|uniref:retention module-containing protein n=1 Tax=Photobacterium leiognathi TaxID=553611 RepID=UPI0027383F1A|nr:retention module-containing protein [Photobacterium leiognathi]